MILAAPLTAILLAALPIRQESPAAPSAPPAGEAPTTLVYYQPEHAPPEELCRALARLLADDGRHDLLPFGNTVVLRVPPEEERETLELAARLDASFASGEPGTPRYVILRRRPRYLSQEDIHRALQPFQRPIDVRGPNGAVSRNVNTSILTDGTLVFRGSRAEVEEVAELLDGLDVAPRQVLFTCYLARGVGETPEEPTLPEELTDDLAELVPFVAFEALATNGARGSARGAVTLSSEFPDGGGYELSLRSSAYDEAARALTLDSVEVQLHRPLPDGRLLTQSIRTGTTLVEGEYTVLGMVGAEPVFVVLRVSAL